MDPRKCSTGSKCQLNVSVHCCEISDWITRAAYACGTGVGSGLFPSDLPQSQSYELIEIAHKGPYYGVE